MSLPPLNPTGVMLRSAIIIVKQRRLIAAQKAYIAMLREKLRRPAITPHPPALRIIRSKP